MNGELAGCSALLTGAGRGLGRAMAIAYAKAGAKVALVSRRESDLAETASAIEALGGEAIAIPCDVAADGSAAAAVERTCNAFGRLDILINNAGTGENGPSLEFSVEQWERLMAINLKAPFFFAQAAAKQMVAQGGGKIINIASMFGLAGEPRLVAYCASKGGLIQMTRALAIEWAKYNIQVNAIAPGYFDTDMAAAGIGDPKAAEVMLRKIPARRFGRPEELGPLAVFLGSAGSDYMTGETIVMDGGQTAR